MDTRRGVHAVSQVTLELVVIFGVGSLFSFFRGYLFTLAGERVVARLRKGLYTHLMNQEVRRHARGGGGRGGARGTQPIVCASLAMTVAAVGG